MLYMYCILKTREKKQPNNTVDWGEELATNQLKICQTGTEVFLILMHWDITEFDNIGTFSPCFTHYYRSNAALHHTIHYYTYSHRVLLQAYQPLGVPIYI